MTDANTGTGTAAWRAGVGAFLEVDGVTLHARRDGAAGHGDPAPPLLYLHALGADLRIFDEVVARLPERRHLRFDLRGHGLSDAPEGAYSIARLAHDALRLLEAHGERRAVLVGVSLGGLVALRAALDRPDAVAGLVLSGTLARFADEDTWRARIETVTEQGVGAIADSTLLRWFPEAFREANRPLIDGMRNMLARTPRTGYAGACAALAAEDLRPRLGELGLRPLVVGGSEDLSTPPPLVREFAAALPSARLEVIDDAGHLPMVDAPARFTELLTGHLAEVAHG